MNDWPVRTPPAGVGVFDGDVVDLILACRAARRRRDLADAARQAALDEVSDASRDLYSAQEALNAYVDRLVRGES